MLLSNRTVRARTSGFSGVDAGGVGEPRVDVRDDAKRVGAAIGKRDHALDERDRLAEQPLFVSPRARRRAKHKRSGEHQCPEIHVFSPFAPAKSRVEK